MSDSMAAAVLQCLGRSKAEPRPYRHWLLDDVLPDGVCGRIADLPFTPAAIGDTEGKRDTHNETRVYFSADNRDRFAVCRDVAEAFQSKPVIDGLTRTCGIDLDGSYLRIEYCQDVDGFWLEPHTDIGAKRFTMLIYLSDAPKGEDWGTDIYDQEKRFVGTAPCAANKGLIFLPGADTWHGFRRRTITGVRRSLIINYVKDEWRARHELAFPDRAVAA